jgi:hypothetical protein
MVGDMQKGVSMIDEPRACDVPFRLMPDTAATPFPHAHQLSIHEQMGIDPMSKLAAAIERLCDILEGFGGH